MRILMSLLIAVFLMGGQAVAKTPDGETPAEEDVCAVVEGKAYGLCNAYCEAKDCDNISYPWLPSNNGCMKLLNKYIQMTGQLPPCEAPSPPGYGECPAWTEEQLDNIGKVGYPGRYNNVVKWDSDSYGTTQYIFDAETCGSITIFGSNEFNFVDRFKEDTCIQNMALTTFHISLNGDTALRLGWLIDCGERQSPDWECYVDVAMLSPDDLTACTQQIMEHDM